MNPNADLVGLTPEEAALLDLAMGRGVEI